MSQRSTYFDVFDEIHQVVLDEISDHMTSSVQSEKYVDINTSDTSKNGIYVMMFTSEAYTLKNSTTIYRQIITDGELVVNAQYLCSIQEITNRFLDQHPQT